MFNLIAIPLGWVMWAIYQVVHSYGLSILLFTLFIKLLTLPSTYKMQVNQARIALLSPQLQKLKKSFVIMAARRISLIFARITASSLTHCQWVTIPMPSKALSSKTVESNA